MKDEKTEKVPSSQNLKPNQKQNFEFVQNSNGTLKIKKYLGNDTNVVIPSEYNGKKVTMIGEKAFRGTNISSITLPISIKEIGDSVFQDCYNLTHVILNQGLEKIGSYAFEATNISSITFPSSIKEFGINAFSSCYNLSKVTLNEGLEKICSTAFWGVNISSITIPSSVKEIDNDAFSNCNNLSQVILNEGLEEIGASAFEWTKIKSIVIPSSVKEINIGGFEKCFNLSKITFNEGLEKIRSYVFTWTNISSITIPSSVKEIGDYVFKNCSKLKEIKVDSNNETYDSRNNCNAIIETETNTLISGCKNTNIPQDIKKIGIGAFSETKISSITIPSSVKEINNRAFENCSDLKKVICKVPKDKITWKWSDLEIDESIVEYA